MAIFIPDNETRKDFHNSKGEYELYKLFQELSDDYYIFHSLEWINDKQYTDGKTWGESDYVIFNPKRGLLVIEVKGGEITSKDRKFYQKNTITKEVKMIMDPISQASRSKYKFKEILRKTNEAFNDSYNIEVAVWFTGVSNYNNLKNLPINYGRGNVLTKEDYKDVEKALTRVFDYYSMKEKTYIEAEKNTILNVLSPEFKALPSLKDRFSEEKFIFKKMTEEQIKILDILEDEKYASIKGGAGTGKTTVAIEKARRLSENGDKVLFLVYNRLLADTLKEKFKDILKNIYFMSLYSLSFNLKKSILDKEETVLDVINKYRSNWEYKHVVIDEGQDFETSILNKIYEITLENKGSLYMFYDHHQLVNLKYRESNWENPIKTNILKLKINCRNTKNIAEIAYSTINHEDSEVVVKNDVIGEKVDFKIYNSEKELYNLIGNTILKYEKEGIKKSKIVILSLKSEEDTILKDIKKIGPFEFVKTFSKDENKILKSTSRKYKGLESDIVIIVDLDEDSLKDEDIRKTFYVSCSRARHMLHIFSKISVEEICHID